MGKLVTKPLRIHRIVLWTAVAAASLTAWSRASAQAHVIEITADSDSRYKIAGQRTPVITVKAGEPVLLRVTAQPAAIVSWACGPG